MFATKLKVRSRLPTSCNTNDTMDLKSLRSGWNCNQISPRYQNNLLEESDKPEGQGYGSLVNMCIDAACKSRETVDVWRRQKRTLERMPAHLSVLLFRCLLGRRLLLPYLLEMFQQSIEEVNLKAEIMVDSEWMVYLGAYRHLRILNLAECKGIKDSALWNLSGLSTLEDLNLSRCSKITNRGLEHLLSLSNLKRLCISETGITANGIKCLSILTSLTSLDLGGLPVTNQAVSSLQALDSLEELDIWGSKINNDGAIFLQSFSNLKLLNLAWTNVTRIPAMASLIFLNMSNCTVESLGGAFERHKADLQELRLSGASFVNMEEAFSSVFLQNLTLLDLSNASIDRIIYIRDMQRLRFLDLSFTGITDSCTNLVAECGGHLERLNLSSTRISSNALAPLVGNVYNLKFLALSHTLVDDHAFKYIAQMPSLRNINLSFTNIKGFLHSGEHGSEPVSSFIYFRDLQHLENLELENTKISDQALQLLPSFLKNLQCLYLKSDYLSDVSLHMLSALTNLKVAGLQGAVLTDGGLLSFVPPPLLELLDLRDCWLLSREALLLFSNSYSHLHVRHELMLTMEKMQHGHKTSQTAINQKKSHNKSKLHDGQAQRKFLDERIKYSRSELLELRGQAESVLTLKEIDSCLSDLLEKTRTKNVSSGG